jgi:hypothetical protein
MFDIGGPLCFRLFPLLVLIIALYHILPTMTPLTHGFLIVSFPASVFFRIIIIRSVMDTTDGFRRCLLIVTRQTDDGLLLTWPRNIHLKTWAKRAQDKDEWELLVVPGEWWQDTRKSEPARDTPERRWWWFHLFFGV